MRSIKLIFLIFFLFSCNLAANAKTDIKIIYKINNNIITNIDIKNEIDYLIALNNQLKKLDKKKIEMIAKDSIIKEKIKEIELLKYFILDQKNPYINTVVKNFVTKLGFENEEKFEEYLKDYNLTIIELKKKIEIETTWNQLIFDKYKNQVNIDKENLKKIIDKNAKSKKSKSYQLAEIIFEKKKNESIKEKTLKIENSIKEIGFENTANTFSISNSAKFGGDIGWIKELNLAKKIRLSIESLKINETTKPIQLGKDFLIIKLKNIKEEKITINKDEMMENLAQSEQNRQLNQFSNIHFNKVKINTYINEL